MSRCVALVLVGSIAVAVSAAAASDDKLAASVDQLRHAAGRWAVVTDFLTADGTIARSVSGTYTFEWVAQDRVLQGQSEIPALEQRSAFLFYVNETKQIIEMTSVGADGRLWIMTGPLGGETRYTQKFETAGGNESQLRFTRFNITADTFESRMEHTEDGGKTWQAGNHQMFRRQT